MLIDSKANISEMANVIDSKKLIDELREKQ
jgi:hypothetical protein